MNYILLVKTYGWLLKTIRDFGPISLKDINKLWKAERMSEGREIARRTFIRHKEDIEELLGVPIVFDRQYRYYIKDQQTLSRSNFIDWLLESIYTNEAIIYRKNLLKRIFVEAKPSAAQYLNPILECMESSVMIDIAYQHYDNSKIKHLRVKPFFLKQYNQRWYLLGETEDNNIRRLALHKIRELTKTDESFVFDETVNAEDYFESFQGENA